MNEDLRIRILGRFSLEEIAEAARVTPSMFIQAFEDEILENLERLADIDLGFVIEKDTDEL
jgi:transcriptional regulator with XRE-family HTH domain